VIHLYIRGDVPINAYQHDTNHAIPVNHRNTRSVSLVYLGLPRHCNRPATCQSKSINGRRTAVVGVASKQLDHAALAVRTAAPVCALFALRALFSTTGLRKTSRRWADVAYIYINPELTLVNSCDIMAVRRTECRINDKEI